MPIWKNCLLSTTKTTFTCLHCTANGSGTKLRYRVYEAMEFTTFKDFLRVDNSIMSRDKLRSTIMEKLMLLPVTLDTVTSRSCTALTQHIKRLWADAKEEWLSYKDNTEMSIEPSKWTWQHTANRHFCRAPNLIFHKILQKRSPIPHFSVMSGIDMN